jgi:hypothetical protein
MFIEIASARANDRYPAHSTRSAKMRNVTLFFGLLMAMVPLFVGMGKSIRGEDAHAFYTFFILPLLFFSAVVMAGYLLTIVDLLLKREGPNMLSNFEIVPDEETHRNKRRARDLRFAWEKAVAMFSLFPILGGIVSLIVGTPTGAPVRISYYRTLFSRVSIKSVIEEFPMLWATVTKQSKWVYGICLLCAGGLIFINLLNMSFEHNTRMPIGMNMQGFSLVAKGETTTSVLGKAGTPLYISGTRFVYSEPIDPNREYMIREVEFSAAGKVIWKSDELSD